MNYTDGRKVMLGDKVDLGGSMFGIVVCSFDDNKFAPGYPGTEWRGLKNGVLVKSEQAGLVHYERADQDFLLLERVMPG
jgi:hypothetical protein